MAGLFKKWYEYLAMIVILGGGIALLCYEIFVSEKPSVFRMACIVLAVAAYVIATIYMARKSGAAVPQGEENPYPDILRDAFQEEPECRARLMEGIGWYDQGQADRALSVLKPLLEECATEREEYAVKYFVAACYSDLEEYEKEIALYHDLLEMDGENALLWTNLGYACNCAGRFAEAKEALKQAITYAPEDTAAHLNLANTEFMLGNQYASLKLVNRVLEQDPGNEDAQMLKRQLGG